MSDLNTRAIKALTDLRNLVREVARSLLDDAPHTYVAQTSSSLTRAIEKRQVSARTLDLARAHGELDGIASVLQVLPRDPWQSFTVDAVRCAAKLMGDLSEDLLSREERCVETLSEQVKTLCNPPETRVLTTEFGAFLLAREDHGRRLAVRRDDPDSEVLFLTRGALSDQQVADRIRLYMAGDVAGSRRGAEEIRASMRLLIGAASADHYHVER